MDSDFTSTRIPEGTRPPGAQRRRQRDPFAIDLDPETADVLVRIYLERRLKYQMDYYDRRASEFENRYDLNYRMGAILMTMGIVSDSAYALAAGTVRGVLRRSIQVVRAQRYFSGSVYIALGLVTAFSSGGQASTSSG